MKVSCAVKVQNPQGLHARPATVIVRMLQKVRSSVRFTYRKETVNAKSIVSLLSLAAAKNSKILIEVEGEDAVEVLNQLQEAFKLKFWEQI